MDIPEKKEVGFARQTSEQETISLNGGSSSLTNSTSRSSEGKMYSFYKNQEIYDPKAISKCQKIIIFFKFFLSAIIFYWQNFLRLLDARQIVFYKVGSYKKQNKRFPGN